MKTLGIVINPFAGGDGRRILTGAPTHSIQAKVRYLSQMLDTLAQIGAPRILLGQDLAGIATVLAAKARLLPVEVVTVDLQGEAEDTQRTVAALGSVVDLLVVLGGDGTQRQAIKARPQVPLFPLPAGTNNAFPYAIDPIYAAIVVKASFSGEGENALYRPKVLRVWSDTWEDFALVDLALYRGQFLGARLLWDPRALVSVALSFAEPWAVGLSALGSVLCPVGRREPKGLLLELGACGQEVVFPWFPGLASRVHVCAWRQIELHGLWTWAVEEPVLVALDGERERWVSNGTLRFSLDSGVVWVLDPRYLFPPLSPSIPGGRVQNNGT